MQAVERLVGSPRGGESSARTRAEQRAPVARFDGVESCQIAVHPIADGTEGVVVERVHARGVEATVRRPAIPALPDGGRSVAHLEQPGWVGVLAYQPAGKLVVAVV